MIEITWKQLLSAILTVVTLVVGGTFTITKLAMDSSLIAYRLQVEVLNSRVKELQSEIKKSSGSECE